MRQLYETPQDREANARLADDFGRALGFALDIAPKACLFAYWVLTPIGQYGIAELRVRACENSGNFISIKISQCNLVLDYFFPTGSKETQKLGLPERYLRWTKRTIG